MLSVYSFASDTWQAKPTLRLLLLRARHGCSLGAAYTRVYLDEAQLSIRLSMLRLLVVIDSDSATTFAPDSAIYSNAARIARFAQRYGRSVLGWPSRAILGVLLQGLEGKVASSQKVAVHKRSERAKCSP